MASLKYRSLIVLVEKREKIVEVGINLNQMNAVSIIILYFGCDSCLSALVHIAYCVFLTDH